MRSSTAQGAQADGGGHVRVVFDDMETSEKVRFYDKAAEREGYESYGESITLRFGAVVIPHMHLAEPLKLECQHFVDCVGDGKTPVSDGRDGMRVVRVLEAAQRSLQADGAPCVLGAVSYAACSRNSTLIAL